MELKFWHKLRAIPSDLAAGESKIIQIFNNTIALFYILDYSTLKTNKNLWERPVDVDHVISRHLFASIIYIKIIHSIKLTLYFSNGNVFFYICFVYYLNMNLNQNAYRHALFYTKKYLIDVYFIHKKSNILQQGSTG